MSRILVTGATGFVGGTVAAVLADRGDDVLCAVRRDPGPGFPWPWRRTDLADVADVTAALTGHRADAALHLAIRNDLIGLYADRRGGYDDYVGMTRRVVAAANAVGALVGYVSTDWVFDGTGHLVPEDEPVSPLNLYGLFKALSEQVVLDGADRGFVARVGGVQGRHLTRPQAPRQQDVGFGYFVLSLVDALSAGRRFTVWEDPAINGVASPITSAEIGAVLQRAVRLGADGVLHVVGGDAVTRRGLALATCAAFDLDPELLAFAPPPDEARLPAPVPYDTSLSTDRTTALLGTVAYPIADQLRALRTELATGRPMPLTPAPAPADTA